MSKQEMELFNVRFDSLTTLMNARFIALEDKLEIIHQQTLKTNGRVTLAEGKITQLEKDGITHYVECPVKAEVTDMKKDLLEYSFFKKYPKVLIGIIIVAMLSIGGGLYASYSKLNKTTESNNLINTQNKIIIERIDSLAKVNNIHFK